MSVKATLALLAGIGCVAPPLAAQRSRVVVVVPGKITQVLTDTTGTPYAVPYPMQEAYRALLAVYAELKLPTEVQDSTRGQLGTELFYRQGSIGGRQISTYLSCGDSMTGPNADSYRVYMNIWSTLSPDGDNAVKLRTAYLAGAVNVSEGSRQPMPCESNGRLELRIHQLLMKRLVQKL